MEISEKDLARYANLTEVERKIRPSDDFTQETLDYFNLDEHLSGTKLPLSEFDDKFRLRNEEITILAGNAYQSRLRCHPSRNSVECGDRHRYRISRT
jgi:hypothetical protein